MEKTVSKINCRKEAAKKTIEVLESKLEAAKRLSKVIKGLEDGPSFMTEEDIEEEERMTHERLLKPKQLIKDIEELEMHPDNLDPRQIEQLQAEIEIKKYFLKSEEFASKSIDNGSSKGDHINFLIIQF